MTDAISLPATEETTAVQPKQVASGRSLFALAFGYLIDQGEGQAMSVLFPTLQTLWGLSYSQLGVIGTIRNILQSVTAPFWGYLSDRYSRKYVIMVGTGIWGIWTLLIGFTTNFGQLLTLRAISGIGLGCLMPAVFSLISDMYPPQKRGQALGILSAIGVLGAIIFTIALGFLATPDLWRWGFFMLGGLSVLSGLLVWWLVDEPVRGQGEPELEGKLDASTAELFRVKLSDVPKLLSIPTIWVAIGQGLAGSMPWVVLGLYFITWLVRTHDMDETMASIIFAAIVVGTAISNVFGGYLGDFAERKSVRFGRPLVGLISVLSGIPLTYLLFTYSQNWSIPFIIGFSFFTALFISWAGSGAKAPMMQNVTPPEMRASAYAFVAFIESGFAALAAYFAGRLADSIGITQAMLWMVPFPWIICALIFSLFFITYPRDYAKLRAEMAYRAEGLS
ncbi:MAG TPA: MFS transporter [Anaerolineae bacterium]|nr:MFS transporter [Anaerolineae bacterium]